MADQQQRAREIGDDLLQQVERVHVEVVGRLVQHHQVAGLGELPGEQQAVALAAREHADRRAELLRAKQEVAQIARDVARSAPGP